MPDPAPSAPAQQPAQPPFGASPATGPVPNKGYEAAVKSRMGLLVKQMTDLLSLAGASSEIGKDILKMLNIATKHAQAGDSTPAAERSNIDRMAMQNTQNAQMMQQLRQAQAQGGGGGGGAPKMPGMAQAA